MELKNESKMMKTTTASVLRKKEIARLLISLRQGPKRFAKALGCVLPLIKDLADFKMLYGICDNLGSRFSEARAIVLEAWEKASWLAQVKLELRRPRAASLKWARENLSHYVEIMQLSYEKSAVAAGIRALLQQLQGHRGYSGWSWSA